MKLRNLIVMTACVALVACSTMRSSVDYDTTYDFAKLKTYKWIPNPKIEEKNQLFDKQFRQMMDKALEAKGYSLTEDDPDFQIAYHGNVQSKVDVTNWGYTYPGWYGGVDVYQYDEGTLITDFVDAKTHNLIYRATVSAEMDQRSTNFERRQQRMQDAVNKILKDFPPPKK